MMRSLLLSLVVLAACRNAPPPPAPTMGTASLVRGELVIARGGHSVPVEGTARVERAARLTSAQNTRGALATDGGAFVLLDQSTELVCDLNKLRITRGRVWVDASRAESTAVESAFGTVHGEGATFAVAANADGVDVYCASGELSYESPRGAGRIAQGESAHLAANAVTVGGEDLWDDWTGGLANPSPSLNPVASSIGALAGRPLTARGTARLPLAIRSHEVNVAIHGDFVTTRVTQVFFNAESETLEGEYRMRLPDNAILGRFAVDTGAGPGEGTVEPRRAASGDAPVWEDAEIPSSALVYDGPHRVRARVYPVSPGAVVTIILEYNEWLTHRDDLRTYVYPMHESGAQLIGEMDISVSVDGSVRAVRAGMGATVERSRIRLHKSDFRPRADFVLDLYDNDDAQQDGANAYVVEAEEAQGADTARFVLVDVSTSELVDHEASSTRAPLELVFLLDASGGTESEDFDLARSLLDALLRQLQPTDRVAVRLSDVSAHALAGLGESFLPATTENRERIAEALSHVETGGATDLARSLRDAATLVADKPRGTVIYVGDGQATTGAVDASGIQAALATLTTAPRFFGVGVGDGANMEVLRGLFGDAAYEVRERTESVRAVMSMLADAARPVLRGVSIETGPSVERSFPRTFASVAVGEHVRLVGRLRNEAPTTIRVHGTRDGVAFVKELAVRTHSLDDEGDITRRWASARLDELLHEEEGRSAMVDLGVRYGIVTPWTSLVVNGNKSADFAFIPTFDLPPDDITCGALHRGCSESRAIVSELGLSSSRNEARGRGALSGISDLPVLPESTWVSRVGTSLVVENEANGDGGLARVAAMRALESHQAGPTSCVERKRMVRPDLAGAVSVLVDVDGAGSVRSARVTSSTLFDADVNACIVAEVRGTRFPATGATSVVSVSHTYVFGVRTDDMRARHTCSDASRQALEVRDGLWRERLAANAGVQGAVSVWNEAMARCELPAWRDRRVLLDRMLRHVSGVANELSLYASLRADASVRSYLRQAILRHVSSPEDVLLVRASLGLEPPLEWKVFARMWRATTAADARLSLVRRWLAVAPEDIDLRLRLLALLEETRAIPEAKRVARELARDGLADMHVRTAVGEFYLRQHDEDEARRVFSQAIEISPFDPWGRQYLGNLYRVHGWTDDAYREYSMLSRLRANDASVLLLLARAASDAGRMDEALRLLQRLSDTVDPDLATGSADIARAWSFVTMAELRAGMHGSVGAEQIHQREREVGILRDPPDAFVALVWKHPEDRPELWMRDPSAAAEVGFERASVIGDEFGIEAIRIREADEGVYTVSLRRTERDALRDIEAELWLVTHPGRADARVEHRAVRLTRDAPTQNVELTMANGLR